MKINIDEVLKAEEAFDDDIENDGDWKSFLHLSVVEIAARIRLAIRSNPMSEDEIRIHFRRRGFGNTEIVAYLLNRYARGATRDYLWTRDEFGRFCPELVYWRYWA